MDELVLELDAAYSSSSIDSPDEADESQELTYFREIAPRMTGRDSAD